MVHLGSFDLVKVFFLDKSTNGFKPFLIKKFSINLLFLLIGFYTCKKFS
jgi:hypothetical protein